MKENIIQKLTSKDDKYACAFTDRIVPMTMNLLPFRSCMNIWKRRAMIWISRISVYITKYI